MTWRTSDYGQDGWLPNQPAVTAYSYDPWNHLSLTDRQFQVASTPVESPAVMASRQPQTTRSQSLTWPEDGSAGDPRRQRHRSGDRLDPVFATGLVLDGWMIC